MKPFRLCLVIVFTVSSLALAATGDDPGQIKAAIKKTIQSYVEAFNNGDAQALAAHWTKDGEYVTPTGEIFTGIEKLTGAFKAFFKNNKGIKIEVKPLAIYVESANKAIEEGVAITKMPGEKPESTRYVTSYIRQNGKWKISNVREIALVNTAPNHDKLKPLEWMIGDWVDEDQTGKLETSCYWSTNGNFIVRSFAVSVGGMTTFAGKQIIGWDPAAGNIRSWVFDTSGGFGEGTWSKIGESWYVNSTMVLNTGEKASSINILTPVDKNSFTWQSTGREIGGLVLPKTPKVTVVRKISDSSPAISGKK